MNLTLDDRAARCFLCGADELIPRLMDKSFSVIACGRCGLTWRTDPPARKSSPVLTAMPVEMSVAEMEEISTFRRPPGLLLNVGRSNSDLLETARMFGFNSRSVEDLEECAEPAHQRRTWRRPDTDPGYDVIRLEGALENDPDPHYLLQRAACLLGEKGLLVISAADFTGWDFPLYGEGARLLPPDLPRWFFSPHALDALLSQNGWKVLKISVYNVPQSPYAFGPSVDSAIPPHAGAILPAYSVFPAQTVRRFRILARRAEMRVPQVLVESARQPVEAPNPMGMEM
jgi:hypothetical protein